MPPVGLRALQRADFALLSRWLAEPHVARWWAHDPSPAAVEADFGASVDGVEPAEYFIAQAGDRAIGLIQRYRIGNWPEYVDEIEPLTTVPPGAASIDYLVGEPDALRCGFGAAMITICVASIWRDWRDAGSVIVPVHADNTASWRVLQRAGFRLVATGEMAPDNPADDRRHKVYRIDRP